MSDISGYATAFMGFSSFRQKGLKISLPKPTLSVNLVNHFNHSPICENDRTQSPSSAEASTFEVLDLENELACSMQSLQLSQARELPDPFLSRISEYEGSGEGLPEHRQFFIMSSAGKPIYSMNGRFDYVMGLMGIVHTLVNYFQLRDGDGDNLRSIDTYDSEGVLQKFAFLRKRHMVLLVMTTGRESDADLQQQLDLLYSYIISTLSSRQLNRLFKNRENFDLRGFLSKSDFSNLDLLCHAICAGTHPGWWLGALECLSMEGSSRKHIQLIMLNAIRDLEPGTLLYGLIVASDHRLVSVARAKVHKLHTTDLQLLFSLMENQLQLLDNDQEAWVPICFPKFNWNGFLYCYVKFLPSDPAVLSTSIKVSRKIKPALILISPQTGAFYKLRETASSIISGLYSSNLLSCIKDPKRVTVNDIPAPLVHHFIYKCKMHSRYFMPEPSVASCWPTLVKYYLHLKSTIIDENAHPVNNNCLSFVRWSTSSHYNKQTHQTSGTKVLSAHNSSDVSDDFFVKEKMDMVGLAWNTPSFELYLVCNNCSLDKNIVLNSAKNIVSFCCSNEEMLFVSDRAVF